jgi:hypothetical protein
MGHVITLEFASNGDVTGSGFRLVAEELTAGCGGILHGMVRGYTIDQITIKTPNPKCRLYWCNRVYRLEIQSVMFVFSTPLVNERPSNLLTGSTIPLSPPFPV